MELYNQEDIRKINEEEKMKEREREGERKKFIYFNVKFLIK